MSVSDAAREMVQARLDKEGVSAVARRMSLMARNMWASFTPEERQAFNVRRGRLVSEGKLRAKEKSVQTKTTRCKHCGK